MNLPIEALFSDHAAPDALVDLVGDRLVGREVQVSFGGLVAPLRLTQPARLRVQVPRLERGLTVVSSSRSMDACQSPTTSR